MAIEATLSLLRKLALAFPRDGCPWEDRPRFEIGASPELVQKLQQESGLRLPTDLLDFLQQCNEVVAMSVHNGYRIGNVANIFSESFRNYFPTKLVVANGLEPAVPVATDGGGNGFLQSLVSGRVWRWDHETGAVKVVAASFAQFLEKVAEDWQHAALFDETWQFLV